jgi:alpha-glucosidase
MQMAADLPENYKDKPEFRFIEDLVVDWDTTIVVNGKIGEYITTVRKDRNSNDWFLGSITNDSAREFEVGLGFLPAGKQYRAEIYQDGKDADMETNPLPVEISGVDVNSESKIQLKLAAGGGTAIRFHELSGLVN